MASQQDRSALRFRYRQARNSLSAEARAEKSLQAVGHLVRLPAFRQAESILIYHAVGSELSLSALPSLTLSRGKRFAYPKCAPDGGLLALLPGTFRPGAFGIPEPDEADSLLLAPEALDLVVCPGTAFDSLGTRLGMGGGYYDRFLPSCSRALFVMAAFEVQRADVLPRLATDVPMDYIVTEKGLFPVSERALSFRP